jgi:putative molybdopterin biosynthesis protein
VCLEPAARSAGLCWRPLQDEQYDFVIPADRAQAPGTVAFQRLLEDGGMRRELRDLGFAP